MLTLDTIRILLLDDHKSFMDGLAMVINSQKPRMEVVATASTLEEARIAAEQKPHLILMDLNLGTASSLDFLPELLANTTAAILVLTGYTDLSIHESAILKGARGVLVKSEPAKTILKAIEKVSAGEIWVANATLGRVLNRLSSNNNQKKVDPEEQKIRDLTAREREIIAALTTFAASTSEEIADQLCISKSTLKNHLTKIYSKLDVTNRVQLMKYALKHNLAEFRK